MKLKADIKMDANTKVVVVWTIILFIILFGIAFLADHKEGFIIINQYQNCSIERSGFNPPLFTNSISESRVSECCYPDDVNCTKDCIYPIGVYTENTEKSTTEKR